MVWFYNSTVFGSVSMTSKNIATSRVQRKVKNFIKNKNDKLTIVAIGASAGGLRAFEKFFTHLPKIGMAYVIITHLARDHESMLPEIIKKYTSLSVQQIKDGMTVKPDTIYVTPVGKNISIQKGILYLIEQSEPHYTNLPITSFFRSLAEDKSENMIAVILSGTGSDGTAALSDIKNYGGITIAQDPSTAEYDGMPRSAINTGLVDYILPVEEIPLQLTKCVRRYGKVKEMKPSQHIQQIFALLRMHTGHDFSNYKINTVIRRVEKQMHGHQIKNLADYVVFLQINPREIDNLFRDLLIGVTRFFRDAEAFDILKIKILPMLLKNKPQNATFRVWIPACSTGEEAYSIGIILYEYMQSKNQYFNVQIFATDIDIQALEYARIGIYPATILTDISPERIEKFFTKEDDGRYKISKEIRSMVVFGEQNIIKDPPFTKLDMISCRNVLIYLNAQLQKKLLPILHYSLKPKGILFLGISEATLGFSDHFKLLSKKWKIFERKDVVTETRSLIELTTLNNDYDRAVLPKVEKKASDSNDRFIQAIERFLLNKYVLPCVVVDKKGHVLFSHGNIDKYFNVERHKENINITDHLNTDIKTAITPVLLRITSQNKPFKCNTIKFSKDNTTAIVNITIALIEDVELLRDLIVILFAEVPSDSQDFANNHVLTSKNVEIADIATELEFTKENLQATIAQLESGHEELQSTNEELQSTNEEIETSREELQSLNEELIIVNTELQNMIDQLATANDDMTNLFNSTEIAALFLDNALNVKRFTPKAQKFVHLIQSDIGRSISHFSTTIKYTQLVQDAGEVLKTLQEKNVEVMSEDNKWFSIRILPYRTLSNVIDGVVITITDINRYKEYEKKLEQLNEQIKASLTYAENIINTVHEPLLVLDSDLIILSANKSFYKTFKVTEAHAVGKYLCNIKNKQFNTARLMKLLRQVIDDDKSFECLKLKINMPGVAYKDLLLNARKICNQINGAALILLAMEFN